jgi:hypothetical protein
VLLLEPLDADRRTWEAMVRGAKKMKPAKCCWPHGVPLVRCCGAAKPATP